jgi:DNA-binding NarL/FixJ family response regulator
MKVGNSWAMNAAKARPLRVALVDADPHAHAVFRRTTRELLADWASDIYLDPGEALLQAPSAKPTVLLVDVWAPGYRGLDCLGKLRMGLRDVRVVVYAKRSDQDAIVLPLAAGACGCLVKPAEPEHLAHVVRQVSQGWMSFCPVAERALIEFLHEQVLARTGHGLTARELEIARLLNQGARRKDIGLQLGIETATVRAHLSAIFWKLGIHSRKQLPDKLASGLEPPLQKEGCGKS